MKFLVCFLFLPLFQLLNANESYQHLFYGQAVVPHWQDDGSFVYHAQVKNKVISYHVTPHLASKKELVNKKSPETQPSNPQSVKRDDRVFIRDHQVYMKTPSGDLQLSFDGCPTNAYITQFYYSHDGRYVVVIKKRHVPPRQISMVESAPKSQLQPIVHQINYQKPGDEIAIELPILFDLSEAKQIHVDLSPYLNQYNIWLLRWNADSKSFCFEYNERGHQTYQLVEVNAETATSRVVIEESFPTFVYYGKTWRYYLDKTEEIIWLSERDGWKHLYLFDATKNECMKQQITRGEWVVREVLLVDEAAQEIYFLASGYYPDENPYYTHLFKVKFDGSGLTDLTPERGNHRITFSPDKKYFVDVYSTPEKEPISSLRLLHDGSIIMQLEQGDASEAEAAGWQRPRTFQAKGRDGKTEIYGNIYFPKNYDPAKKYPVLEYIYAGPHDSHVVNDFHLTGNGSTAFTDCGYIVVQIDGMGTYNRSKAFHDVCWKNLKDAGFPDRKAWIKAAAKQHPSMDLDRVGIYGVSAGGQNAMAALLFHADLYKAAAAACGCHDNRMDKIWWNEQWMGYPVDASYSQSSNVDNAHLLKGRLLLIVGELDKNVDPASTYQVADALIKAGKYFEFLPLPGQGHSMGGKYGEARVIDFFERNLKGISQN